MGKEKEELQVLKHEEVPGYRSVFYIVMAVAVIYLAVMLLSSI
jgi:cell division protein FtsL